MENNVITTQHTLIMLISN